MARLRRRSPARTYVPVLYLFAAIALAVVLLPSALRPPQDQQTSSLEFSPDAPPDENPPETLLAAIRQASSATAGGEGVIEVRPVTRKAARGRCYGDPPRQTESLYSHLCVPAFTGPDNGGATAKGVYPDEIRIGITVPLESETPEGALEKEFRPTDTDEVRLLKVWQTYFNQNFEFYKRYMRLYVRRMSSTDEDLGRATVQEFDDEDRVFAIIGPGATPSAAAIAESIRRKIIVWAPGQNPVDFYKASHPYAYSFEVDSWQTRYLGAELSCKLYAGKPPGDLNGKDDPTFDYSKPRIWGLLIYQDEVRAGAKKMYEDRMRECNTEFAYVHEFNLTDNQAAIGDAMAKFRSFNVTTILMGVDPVTPAAFTNASERIRYFPEWICSTGCESNTTGRLMDNNQAENVVSLASGEIPRADADKDWYRAFKEVDPDGEPDNDYFRDLQQTAGGIQHAGPRLTPQTFWEGLSKQPCRTPDPIWSIGGCYKKPDPSSPMHYLGDYTYQDFFALQWFDNSGDDPDSSTSGAWCFMYFGKRFQFGQMPTEPLPWRDPKQCFFEPPRGEQG